VTVSQQSEDFLRPIVGKRQLTDAEMEQAEVAGRTAAAYPTTIMQPDASIRMNSGGSQERRALRWNRHKPR
jgi:hypothetical protein